MRQKINLRQLAAACKHVGTGMSKEEVQALCEEIDLEALKSYRSWRSPSGQSLW